MHLIGSQFHHTGSGASTPRVTPRRSWIAFGGKPVRRHRKTSGRLREAAIYGEVTALAGYKFRVMQLGRLVKEKVFDEATPVKEWSNWKMYADGAWIGKQEFQQIQREDSDFHLDQRIYIVI